MSTYFVGMCLDSYGLLPIFCTEHCVSVFLCFHWQSERETATGTEK